MKHILPILTITTLAAAASAQSAAAPAGLSYNRVSISREGQNNSIAVSSFLGSSNVLATVSTTSIGNNGRNYTSLSVGYVFKNVAAGIDATVGVTTGGPSDNSAVTVNLRRALNEVVSGLEVAVGATFSENADNSSNVKGSSSIVTAELAYNINKTWSVAYGISNSNPFQSFTAPGEADVKHVISVRHNF